jgi:IS30 family transposase
MTNQYHHLSLAERYVIDKLFSVATTIRGIALILGRSPSTISSEIKRNSVNGEYLAEKAKHKAYVKRKYSKAQCLKVAMDDFLYRFVLEKLQVRWSPEQMSGYLARQNIKVSTKAIYKFIGSRGLEYMLFWSWNKKKSGRKQYHYGQAPDGRKYIEERPMVNGPWHYELDFIVSKQSAWVLLVAIDRLRKKTWVIKLPNRKRDTVRVALQRLFHGIDLKSITTDNDIAFACWRELEACLHTKIYFTHPYHSWEKGLVENTNRWIRCFVHKRRDISSVTQEELEQIHAFLNDRPRKCLGYFSANELLLINSECSA